MFKAITGTYILQVISMYEINHAHYNVPVQWVRVPYVHYNVHNTIIHVKPSEMIEITAKQCYYDATRHT